jgi:1-acyl-sn-glycerol-3-phosphate acyltransferase
MGKTMTPSRYRTRPITAPGVVTPRARSIIRRVAAPWVRLCFRPTLSGLEHLPATGPYLLVANHSAGLAVAEICSLMAVWQAQAGPERPLAGFAHPLGLRIWPASAILAGVGAVPSTYDAAREALAAGVPLLIFPGGDHEAMRPVWQAHRVDFGGRRGFLRIAREMNVPIVPLGIRGSHFTVPILWRSRHLLPWGLLAPRLLGVKRWPLTALGVAGLLGLLLGPGAAWSLPAQVLAGAAWLTSPLVCLPVVPATIRFRIGPALSPEMLFGSDGAGRDGTEDAVLDRALARVEAAVQAMVSSAPRPPR